MRSLTIGAAVLVAVGCVLPEYRGAGEGGGGGASAGTSFPAVAASSTTTGEPAATGTGLDSSSSESASTSTNAGVTSSHASSTSAADSATSTDAASTSTGGDPCLPALPPCGDVTPFDFSDQEELEKRFDVDKPEARVSGGKLRLDPDPDGTEAVLKSKAEATLSGDCAIWIKIRASDSMGGTGIGLGNGALSGSPLRIERRGDELLSFAGGTQQASTVFDKDETELLRIRAEVGSVYLDYGADPACWQRLSGPHSVEETKVILFHQGSSEADLDDYCID